MVMSLSVLDGKVSSSKRVHTRRLLPASRNLTFSMVPVGGDLDWTLGLWIGGVPILSKQVVIDISITGVAIGGDEMRV